MSEKDDGRSIGSGRSVRRMALKLSTAAKMARVDVRLARAWLRYRGAVEETLGAAEAAAYTNLVEFAGRDSLEAAYELAVNLPDQLALVEPSQRARYVSLLRVVLRDQSDAIGIVSQTLPRLLRELDDESLALYMSRALDLHRTSRSKAKSFLLMESDQGVREASRLQRGVVLRDVRRTLTLYARAHCGENVQVRASEAGAFTDGRHVYLPSRIDRFGDERDFLVYRVLTARNVGFLEFGSLEVELESLEGQDLLQDDLEN